MEPDRLNRPISRPGERKLGDESGPSGPEVNKPKSDNELMRRLKKVDPDRAKNYRQRSGQ
ncbi:MAG: ubiquitin-like protein UBact [Armatimonadetes bacterium]|jgi:hypothetical protein|nr:ubiquitin-like protein UBact [Armatimonadota bacterium]